MIKFLAKWGVAIYIAQAAIGFLGGFVGYLLYGVGV